MQTKVRHMTPDYFTSQFTEKNPYSLRQFYNQRFIKSLLSLVDSSARGFKKDYTELKNIINTLNPNKKFNPRLHALHASLVNSLKENNILEVFNLMLSLSQVLKLEAYASSFEIKTISSEFWEQGVLESLKELNRNQNGKLPTIDRVDEACLNKYKSVINESMIFLKKASLLFYNEFETYVAEIKLFNSDRLVGMTDPRVFGSVYICIPNSDLPPEVYFCEHIIHETSHLHLNTLFAQDCLILNDPNERYTAPIRPDPRPMYGIFHATFVLSRMVRVFYKLVELLGNSFYSKCLAIFQKQFFNGYTTIISHAKLTQLGQKIVQSYSDIVEMRG